MTDRAAIGLPFLVRSEVSVVRRILTDKMLLKRGDRESSYFSKPPFGAAFEDSDMK